MSNTTWEEIKKLAADFQRVQLTESSFSLTERNCIEIITKLIKSGQLNVIHTLDGKDFITQKHLEREIYDEIYVHQGRINIVTLQTILNVDISYIESKVNEIVKNDPNLNLILGQIISKDYMNKISEEINEKLQEKGSVSIAELTNMIELPADFIQQIIQPRLGTLINGSFDGKIIYTHNYVNNQKALVAGVLEASIKPIRLSHLIKEYNIDSGMIFQIVDDLISSNQVKGSLIGGRQEMSAIFVPAFFTKAQQKFVESFFKQNGYIDYASLKKIGINEPDSYIKSLIGNEKVKYLSSSCFANYYLDQLDEEIDETLKKSGFIDLSQSLPSFLNVNDLNELTRHYQKKLNSIIENNIMADTFLVSKDFLKNLNEKLQNQMESKSEEDFKRPNFVLAVKHQKIVIGNLTGVASNQNETKQSKSKSKKVLPAAESLVDSNQLEVVFMDQTQLINQLKTLVKELPDDLIDPLVENFLKPINVQYINLLKTKVEQGLVVTSNQQETASTTKAPVVSSIKNVQEKVKLFLINCKIFEKATKVFTEPKVQELLSKHLIKTTLSEILNEMLKFISTEQLITISEENLNNDSRLKIIQKLKEPQKQRFLEINQALNTKSCAEIIELIEKLAVDFLELTNKKPDIKKEKELVLQLRENTRESLEKEKEPATVLHLTSVLLFCYSSGLMINMPGRCVPNVLDYLKPFIQEETHEKLNSFQNLIIEKLSSKSKVDQQNESINEKLIDEIKSIGLNAKSYLKKENK